jgi:hypothetical protein
MTDAWLRLAPVDHDLADVLTTMDVFVASFFAMTGA